MIKVIRSKYWTEVPNQYVMQWEGMLVFQSYDAIIAVKKDNKVYLNEKMWDHSNTTAKYRNKFLNCDTKECLKKIKSGEYQLVDMDSFL